MIVQYNGDIGYLKKQLKEHMVITKDTIIQGKFQIFSSEKHVVDKNGVIFIKK